MVCQGTGQDHVTVSGVGLVTPLGSGASQTFRALLDGRMVWETRHHGPSDPLALIQAVGRVPLDSRGRSEPAATLALLAAHEACREARVDPGRMPLILASSKGEVEALVRRRAEAVAAGPHGLLAGTLQRNLGSRRTQVVVAACASGLVALNHAHRMLLHGGEETPASVLVVATDASLVEPFVHSYRRLGVLAPPVAGRYREDPLSQRRRGFVLAESAAAVVLTRTTGPRDALVLDATSHFSEIHDIVRPAPDPVTLSHLATTLLAGRPISMLHPHAPGIEQDELELRCYLPHLPRDASVYACKGAVGHSLGAAGLVSFVIACLCARHGESPPMPWLDQPVNEVRDLLNRAPERKLTRHAVFASGFGGHAAGAVIEACRT